MRGLHERAARKKRGGCLRQVVAALSVLTAVIPVGVWVLQRSPGEDWWLSAALVYAPTMQWLALPVIGLMLALIARSRGLVAVSVAGIVFALFAVAGYQLNIPPPIPEGRPTIRLATWNVHGRTTDRELVRDRIMSWDCDIVCLQESASSIFADLLPGYESSAAGDLRTFVRGRIAHREAPADASGGPRRILIVDAETDAGPITVINVHLPRGEAVRRTPRRPRPLIRYIEAGVQARDPRFDQLVGALPEQGPVILAGDMNVTPASRYYAQVAERLTDSFTEVGRGFGNTFVWRQKLPVLRIDYVWTGGGVEPLSFETRHHLPSDHRPVITELALPGSTAAGGQP
ncbi:MAG: endonuclease/exonuclease/phosphatase family protein [Armatimonadota bacterium]|jgi:endonuclease/exonuclease/phosphatase family metal-dependent hydrolase